MKDKFDPIESEDVKLRAGIDGQMRFAPVVPTDEIKFNHSARPIEEILMELAKEIPKEEWDKMPPDFLDELDHYIYGTPKKEQKIDASHPPQCDCEGSMDCDICRPWIRDTLNKIAYLFDSYGLLKIAWYIRDLLRKAV